MGLESKSDEALAALSAAGDMAAAEQLIRRYKDFVKQRADRYFLLGGDGQDMVQEGMIGMFAAAKTYDPTRGASFRTYANLCVNRQIISAFRGAGRLKHAPLNTSLSLDGYGEEADNTGSLGETLAAGWETDPESCLLFGETARLLLESKSFFSPLEGEILDGLLRGETYLDMAAALERTPKSVDNAIQRVRRKLRVFLDENS